MFPPWLDSKTITRASMIFMAVLLGASRPDEARATSHAERHRLQRYARDTWHSFELLRSNGTGLPADHVEASGIRAGYTSPTDIASDLWSTLVARDLGIIDTVEARAILTRTLQALARLERDAPSGLFYNWYDPATAMTLAAWPETGNPVPRFVSSVDNAWLAAALIMLSNAESTVHDQALTILSGMDFGQFYDPAGGLMRGGFWLEAPAGCSVEVQASGGRSIFQTCHHYGVLNSETRIVSYVAIALGQTPPEHYFKMSRTFPATCDASWQEMEPSGESRTYLGTAVFEGHYRYRGMNIVPSWGGSMFEALMVPLLVPEDQWAPQSWGRNHPLYVQAQIAHGLEETQCGFWGFSPSSNPSGGYREYGVDAIGSSADGYTPNNGNTIVDYGFASCPGRPAQPLPTAGDYRDTVVTPHAVFLALPFAPEAVFINLANLEQAFDVYGEGGFYDAVDVQSGAVATRYLALDQAMIMLAIGNALTNRGMQRYMSEGIIQSALEPLLGMEAFTAGLVANEARAP